MTTDKDQQIGYASVNGLDIYYEIRGSGEPLVLLPGGFMTVEAMGKLVPQLAATRRVIGVELQGHGHTADIERALRFEVMADDIAALIRHLGLDQADILAFPWGAASDYKPPSGIQRWCASSHSPRPPSSVMGGIPRSSREWPRSASKRLPGPRYTKPISRPPQARSLADLRCQDETLAERGLRLGRGRCGSHNTHPDPGRGRRRLAHRARGGVLWSARRRQGGRRHKGSPACPARGAPGHHACWLGPTVSWDHEPHPTAPADHHGIPRFSMAGGQVTSCCPIRGHLVSRAILSIETSPPRLALYLHVSPRTGVPDSPLRPSPLVGTPSRSSS